MHENPLELPDFTDVRWGHRLQVAVGPGNGIALVVWVRGEDRPVGMQLTDCDLVASFVEAIDTAHTMSHEMTANTN